MNISVKTFDQSPQMFYIKEYFFKKNKNVS